MNTRRIDHVALTVPDVEEASAFFEKAFGARVIFDGQHPSDPPVQGKEAEVVFGMPRGSSLVWRRVLAFPGDTHIELFQFVTPHQQRAAHTYDYGLVHFAVLVQDLGKAALDFQKAGGKLYCTEDWKRVAASGMAPKQGWMYGETPWGTVIEMVTFEEI